MEEEAAERHDPYKSEHAHIHTCTNVDTYRVHTILCTRTCMNTHTLSYTPTNHETSQIFTNVHTNARACVRARTHTLKRTHTHHAYGYAMGATAVHTLFSSYAHTIILLC